MANHNADVFWRVATTLLADNRAMPESVLQQAASEHTRAGAPLSADTLKSWRTKGLVTKRGLVRLTGKGKRHATSAEARAWLQAHTKQEAA